MSAFLDPKIQQKLRAFAQRRRKLIIIKGVLAAVAALVLTMLAVAFVDLKWMLPDWVRWTLSGVAYTAVLVVVWRECLRQLLHAPDERQLARLIEHAEPGLREDLLSAVELGRTPGEVFDSEQFRSLLQADVARRMGGVEVGALLPVKLIRRYIGWAAAIGLAMLAIMAASGWRFHTLLLRALLPGANLERVSRTKVIVQEPEGGDRIVPQGDTVRVVVQLAGEPSNRARIETMGDGKDGGGWQVMDMEPLGNDRFAATVQVSRASVRYRVKAGDALTRKYLLDARERPFVTEFQKTFHFPKYSELPDRSVTEKEGALIALEGSEVDLKLKTNQPVKHAELLIEQGKTSSTVALTPGEDGLLAGKITMNASGSYRVHLTGAETGFENKFSPENEIRAEPDLVPSVELESPKNDLILPANELVDIAGNATDDLGLAKVSRLVRINDKGWRETVLVTKPGKETHISDRWDLFQMGVKPGDLLTMKLVATDLKGSRAESRPLQVTITASGFEMRRLQGLESLRALNESVRTLSENAAQLVSTARKANEGIAGKEAETKQAVMAITGALTEFDAKFTESWTTLGGALRESKTAHGSAELAMLGRSLARIGFGLSKFARSDAAALPSSRKLMTGVVETCAEIAQRTKLASAMAEAITLSEESAVLAENGLILHREQKRLMEMASAAGNDPAQWAALAGRLRVAASQTKVIEEILAPMTVRTSSHGKDRAKVFALQIQKHREALTKSLSPDDKPDRRMLQKLAEFNRGIEGAARGFSDWSREFGNRPSQLMRETANDAKPVYASVGKLAETLEAIRKEPNFPADAQSALAVVRWKACGELFKTSGDLEEIRHHADNQFVSDVRQTVAAIEALSAISAGSDPAQLREKLDALDAVFRVLESGHNLQETMDGFTQLASSERWEVRDLAARTDAPRDWRWLEARMRLMPDELGRAKPPRATEDLAKAFAGAQEILWKTQQVEAWQGMEREMAGRASFDYAPATARQHSEQLAGRVKLALDLLRKPMDEARKELTKLSPTVSQLASALAKEQAEVKKETEKRAKDEQQKNPDDAKAEAEKQIAQQQQLNQKVETLKDLVRADANKQDILKLEEREKMRDADDALALLKDPPPKAEQALQDAAAAAPAQQKADLERAAEQQQKLAGALKQIADHFEKMEQGKPAEDSRTALREAEKELGIKEELDAQQAHAKMLAEMAQKDPAALLKELEAKLPENPAMQKELSTISKDALADAEQKLADARGRENNVAKQLEMQAKLDDGAMQKAQQGAAEAAKQAQQAAEAAKQAAQSAEQQAKAAQNPNAEKQAQQAGAEAEKAAQSAQQAAEAAEKIAKADYPSQASDAAKQTAQKAGESAQAAQKATDAAKQATASAQRAAQKPGEHQAQNQEANQHANEAAQQAQKANDAAKRAQDLAQQAAELAEATKSAAAVAAQAMVQQNAQQPNSPQANVQPGDAQKMNQPQANAQPQQNNPQLANAAQQQKPVAANAGDAADTTDRAGRHEARLGNQMTGEQLQKLANAVRDTATKQVPATQQALEKAAKAADAQAPVNATSDQLAQELKTLQNAQSGQPQTPANATAQTPQAPMQAGKQAGTPESAQAAAEQAAQAQSAKTDSPQAAGTNAQTAKQQGAQPPAQGAQQAQAASSPAEQQAMARALDALDQQLNPSAAQAAENGEGQQGQQQQGGQQQNGKQQGQGQEGNQPGQKGQQDGAKSASQSAMAQAAQAASDSMRKSRAENSSPQPGSLLSGSQSDKSLGGAKAEGTAMNAKDLPSANGLKRGDWGRLPKKLAEQLTKGSQEAIPGEYRQAVETYYRVIAEKTKKRP
jgi:hypothetical protein